jgi:Tol biopolymer transport system component
MNQKRPLPIAQISLLFLAIVILTLLLSPRPTPIPLHTPMIAYATGGSMYMMNLDCIHTEITCKSKRQPLRLSPDVRVTILHRWSPNGKQILFYQAGWWDWKTEGFFLIDPETGQTQPLFSTPLHENLYPLYEFATIAPDGKHFIFTNLNEPIPQHIYIADMDGRNQRSLLSVKTYIGQISWSPDGRYITYEIGYKRDEVSPLQRIQHTSLWIANADGTNPRFLANYAINPVWSPDSSQILYSAASGRDETLLNLMSVRPDGTNLTQLTEGGFDYDAAWSPDGQTIAYTSANDLDFLFNWAGGELMLMQPDGSNKRKLSTFGKNHNLSWSPDSRYLAYLSRIPTYPKFPTYASEFQLFVAEVQSDQHYQITFDKDQYAYSDVIWRP